MRSALSFFLASLSFDESFLDDDDDDDSDDDDDDDDDDNNERGDIVVAGDAVAGAVAGDGDGDGDGVAAAEGALLAVRSLDDINDVDDAGLSLRRSSSLGFLRRRDREALMSEAPSAGWSSAIWLKKATFIRAAGELAGSERLPDDELVELDVVAEVAIASPGVVVASSPPPPPLFDMSSSDDGSEVVAAASAIGARRRERESSEQRREARQQESETDSNLAPSTFHLR